MLNRHPSNSSQSVRKTFRFKLKPVVYTSFGCGRRETSSYWLFSAATYVGFGPGKSHILESAIWMLIKGIE